MRKSYIVLATAAIVLTVSGLRAADVWRWRSETLRTAEARASNLSEVVAQYLIETFAASDAALRQLALNSTRFGGPAAPESEWAAALATAKASLSGVGSISVVDRNGVIRHSTQPMLVGQSRADAYVFKVFKSSTSDDLAIDIPFQTGRETHRYVIPIGRRILDAHGAFDGVVVATFIPEELRPFLNGIGTGPHGVVWVFHLTGVVVFREPTGVSATGSPARGNPLFDAAASGASTGTLGGWTDQDGRVRIAGYRRTDRPPLIVAVSLDRTDALAEVRRVAYGSLTFFVVACVLIGSALAVLFRQMDAKARAEAALQGRQRLETERLHDANRLLTDSLQREQLARQEAEAANALKDQFLMTVSHELRTPLTAIYGWARMLATGSVRDSQRDAAVGTIEKNARAQMRIIDDLLDAARVMNGKLRLDLRPVDAAAIVRDAVDTVRPAASAKSIGLEAAIEGPCNLVADGDRLQQIVWNLLSNAVKFTPEGGSVSVAAQRVGSSVEITVTDTGAGISPAFLPDVFDRFRQQDGGTNRQHGGLGLGLAIARSLVELHGGTIAADSDGPGRGAAFTVRVPAEALGVAGPEPRTRRETVRDAALRGVRGTRCRRRTRSADAVQHDPGGSRRGGRERLVGGRGPRLPCGRPVRRAALGYRNARRGRVPSCRRSGRAGIGGRSPLAKIAVSAYSRPEDEARSLAAGFDRFLRKPVDPEALVSAIDDVRPQAVH